LFLRTDGAAGDASPDSQIKCGGLKFVPPGRDRDGPEFTLAPVLVQPRSVGEVQLRSTDPSDTAVLDPGYLNAQADVDAMVAAIELARELVRHPAFDDFRGDELAPGAEVTGKPRWLTTSGETRARCGTRPARAGRGRARMGRWMPRCASRASTGFESPTLR
jgi:choline dehydrogenase-like flavoprotein